MTDAIEPVLPVDTPKMRAKHPACEPACLHCPARLSDLCAGVPDRDLKLLSAISTHQHLAPGETLVMDGDSSDYVYNVISGALTMTRHSADGRRQILAFLFGGKFVGFSSDAFYRFNIEAVTQSEICRFERRKLEPLFTAYPDMEKRFRRMAAKAVEDSLDLVFTLGRHNATERVAAFLLYLRALQPEGEVCNVPMTRSDIADYLGLTIETVSRTLTRLKSRRLVKFTALHSFEILDEARLRAAAGES